MTLLHPDDDQLWALLDRYLAGEARAREAEAVRTWLAGDPARVEVLEELRRIRNVAARRPPVRSAEVAWRSLVAELGVETQEGTQQYGRSDIDPAMAVPAHDVRPIRRTPPHGTVRLLPQRRSRVGPLLAAAALLVAAIGYPAWRSGRAVASERVTPVPPPPRVFAASRGQRAEIRLTDGTQVVLAADSRITIPADFDSTRRTVTLVGEAYFDVVHNNLKPFVVNARGAVVRDIGTRFDVRAYPADASVRLVVTHGEVKLRHAAAPDMSGQLLHAGQLTRMDSQGVISEVRRVDTTRYVAWTRGVLEFIDTPMPDVATEIGRWYDVDIHLRGSALTTRRLTATVHDQPLSGMLEQLAVSLDAQVERKGRIVTLTPKLVPPPPTPDVPAAVPVRDDPPYHS